MDRDKLFIQHILEATEQICDYVSGVSFDEFSQDRQLQDAVIYRIQVIGEAVKNLSADFIVTRPHVPWKDIAGMRDRLVHHYFDVDLSIVYEVATTEVPQVEEWLKE